MRTVGTGRTETGIITCQAIRRGSFRSLAELMSRIDHYITGWGQDAAPFEWIATADEIIEKVSVVDQDYRKIVAKQPQVKMSLLHDSSNRSSGRAAV